MHGRFSNDKNNSFEILHDLFICESKHAISTRCKPPIAAMVMTNALLEIVAFSIEFNDDLARMGDKVRDVMPHRALSPKSESSKSMRLQLTPKQALGASHRAS